MRESIGEYKILERVGAGGSAEVYRARDTQRGRTAAIKVLTSDVAMDPALGPTFVTEANLATAIDHPSIASLYEIDEQDGRPHLVFEFVPGQPLRTVLGGQPLNARQALEYATNVADGLADAHAGGVVHRMLNPDKVFITPKGTARLIDLGLGQYAMAVARRVAAAGTSVPAMTYWAPEQLAGGAGDPRSDLWALGQLLAEMLTGQPPTRGQAPNTNALPADLRLLVARLTTESPDRRPQSAATVAGELRTIASALDARRAATVPAAMPPAPRAADPPVPRWVIAIAIVVAISVVLWLVTRA